MPLAVAAQAATSIDWVPILAGFIGGSTVAAIVSAWALRVNERHADNRHLRDRRADRLRATFKPLLHIAETRAEAIHRQKFVMEGETVESRDAGVADAIRQSMEGYTQAIVAVQLEPRIGAGIAELFQETYRAWAAYQAEISIRATVAAQGAPRLDTASLEWKEKTANDSVETLHAAMLKLLDELEQPMPPKLFVSRVTTGAWLTVTSPVYWVRDHLPGTRDGAR